MKDEHQDTKLQRFGEFKNKKKKKRSKGEKRQDRLSTYFDLINEHRRYRC